MGNPQTLIVYEDEVDFPITQFKGEDRMFLRAEAENLPEASIGLVVLLSSNLDHLQKFSFLVKDDSVPLIWGYDKAPPCPDEILWSIQGLVHSSQNPVEINSQIAKLKEKALREESSKGSFRLDRDRHRELNLQAEELEKLVGDRTQSLYRSKVKLEEHLNRLRSLVRFISGVEKCLDLGDIVLFLQKEFRHLGRPIIGVSGPKKRTRLAYNQGYSPTLKEVAEKWEESSRLRFSDSLDREYLARNLGRPIGPLLSLPLTLLGQRPRHSRAILFLELYAEPLDQKAILDPLQGRLEPLVAAIDKILLQEDLDRASEMWESSFDGIVDPIAIVSASGSILRCNRAFRQKLEGWELPRESIGDSVSYELFWKGQVFQWQSYPISLGEGSSSDSRVFYFSDMTREFQFQQRVIQNEKMAALGQLAGNIAHELNNPLTGIRSMAQILLGEWDPESRNFDDLKEIELATERCQAIIRNLLDFSGEAPSKNLKVIDLNSLVNKTLPLLKTPMRHLNSEIQLDPRAPKVEVEPHLLQQVVFNLVNNACQASEEGARVRVTSKIVNGESVELSVEDKGKGIPEDLVEKIFEPFFTTKDPGQGTGLGLSVCREVIRRFQGELAVESQWGEGSRFYFRLPLVKGE